jgi:hypothetical protein
MIQYNIVFKTLVQSGYVNSNCAEITFINNGTADVTINSGLTLSETQSIAIGGNDCEIDTTKYNIVFASTGIPKCIVVQKYYNQIP